MEYDTNLDLIIAFDNFDWTFFKGIVIMIKQIWR